MRLWTIQSLEVYNIINCVGIYHNDGKKSKLINIMHNDKFYQWMIMQMKKRIGNPPIQDIYPIWAWHTMNWQHSRPDLRKVEFKSYKKPFVLMEIEISNKDVLLSDEELWNYVLSDTYLSTALTEEEYEKEILEFSKNNKENKIEESWEKIFCLDNKINNGWIRIGCYIQATFWEIKKENIIKVWIYK